MEEPLKEFTVMYTVASVIVCSALMECAKRVLHLKGVPSHASVHTYWIRHTNKKAVGYSMLTNSLGFVCFLKGKFASPIIPGSS